MAKKKIDIYHKPNWPPELSSILGDLKGRQAYVTEIGTIHLLGPDTRKTADVPKDQTETEKTGPMFAISAKGMFS